MGCTGPRRPRAGTWRPLGALLASADSGSRLVLSPLDQTGVSVTDGLQGSGPTLSISHGACRKERLALGGFKQN